jgi:hypothetical protein
MYEYLPCSKSFPHFHATNVLIPLVINIRSEFNIKGSVKSSISVDITLHSLVTVQLCFIGMAYLIIRVKDYGK